MFESGPEGFPLCILIESSFSSLGIVDNPQFSGAGTALPFLST
jgi:hypothetical protein